MKGATSPRRWQRHTPIPRRHRAQVEMLVQRDREMTRYIEEEYPERMESAKKSVTEKRDVVVALLEHFSGELQRKDNLPTCGGEPDPSLAAGCCGCAGAHPPPAGRRELTT